MKSISLAGGGLKLPITPTTNILNSPVPGAYPISTSTYLLIYKDQTDETKGQTLVDFVYWALTKGSSTVVKLNYSPLPVKVQKGALLELKQITSGGTPIQPSSTVKS